MKIRIANIVNDSIVDGPGLRLTVFTQGCRRACLGCHNPQTQNPNEGREIEIESIIEEIKQNPLLDGVTISGGEPLEQPAAVACLARRVKELGKELNLNVWLYTGYLWEEILARDEFKKILPFIDVVVDGPFQLDKKSLELKYRGSFNQRIINVGEKF
jgi:anaerobic ribonucleoside-triphosphate reductase activating protein